MNEELDKALIEFAAATERLDSPSPWLKYVITAGVAALLAGVLQMFAAQAEIDGAEWPLWIVSTLTLLLLVGSCIAMYRERTRTAHRCRELAYAAVALDEGRSA